MSAGVWTVWGDAVEPVAINVDHATMKAMVDGDESHTYYGEDQETAETYPNEG